MLISSFYHDAIRHDPFHRVHYILRHDIGQYLTCEDLGVHVKQLYFRRQLVKLLVRRLACQDLLDFIDRSAVNRRVRCNAE